MAVTMPVLSTQHILPRWSLQSRGCNSKSLKHRHAFKTQQRCASALSDQTRTGISADRLHDYRCEVEVKTGKLLLRPLEETDISAACVVLTRAFAGTPEQITMSQALSYTRELLLKAPNGFLLVACLYPEDPANLPPNQNFRLVGTVGLSLTPDTREDFQTLPPPEASGYISNVAVDNKFRRQGIARTMMTACEELVAEAGLNEVYLHVRTADPAAQQLYQSLGYQEQARDNMFANFRRVKPRILMGKKVA